MINVTSAFRTKLNNDERDYLLYADITLKNGTTLSVTRTDMWSRGFAINDAVSTDGNFDVGAAIINGAKLVLNNIYPLSQNTGRFSSYDFTDARVVLSVGLNVNGSVEKLRKGTYTVDEALYNGSLITLSLLDYMAKFDKPYSDSTCHYPATLGTIVQDACTRCGVTLNTYNFPHYTHIVQDRPEDNALTYREVISYAAQIAGCFARCDTYGRLELKWFPSFSNAHQLSSTFSRNLGVDNVVITGVTVEQKVQDQDGTEVLERYTSGNTGYMITISNNPLIQGSAGQTIANWLGTQLIGVTFRNGEVDHLSNPAIEAGDVGKVTDPRGNTYNILISSTTFKPGVSQHSRSSAPTPSRNSARRYSEAAKTYVELREKLQQEKTTREQALEEFAQRIAESPGLYTTVETQQDGSKIYYMHNKPLKSESDIVWKMTAEAWGVSTNGGQSWNGGMTVDGDVITRILTATGINVEYINLSGRLSDAANKNFWDLSTGEFQLSATTKVGSSDTVAKASDLDSFVVSTDVEYGNSDSQSTAPSTWTTNAAWVQGKYLWTRTKMVLEDGNVQYSTARRIANDKGLGVSSVEEQYYLSTSNSTQTGGSWGATQPQWVKDRYYWTRSKITWSDGSITYTDPVLARALTSGNQSTNDLDDSFNQQKVFNRLTNNGETQGIYLSNGRLYINATYIATGTLADANNNVTFNLSTGTLTMNKGSINIADKFVVDSSGNLTCTGADIQGTFKTGTSAYWLKLDNGSLIGGRGSRENARIDLSAGVFDDNSGYAKPALLISADYAFFDIGKIVVSDSGVNNMSHAQTETVTVSTPSGARTLSFINGIYVG